MDEENDALETGGDDLTIDQAAARYAAVNSNAVPDQAEEEAPDDSETTDDLNAPPEGGYPDDEAEDEGETGAEDQAEDEEQEPESDQGRFVADNAKVRLEDGRIVSVSELKKGSLLNADYTRKTQEVAEQRRSVESQSAQLKQLETQLSEQREYVSQLMQSILPQEPDPALAATDPYGYTTQKANYDAMMRHVAYLQQQSETQRAQQEAEAQAARVQKSNAELAALIEKVPAFKDQTRFTGFVNDAREFGQKFGFSPQELAEGIGYDHRMAMVLHKAIQWEKLQASKPKVQSKVEGRPPIQKGGKRLSPDGQRARTQSVAMERLKTSGSVDDAVAAYLASQKG